MKWGILGGTFDPIHIGHLAAARAAMECAHLDRVVFIPSAQPPHRAMATASAADRLAMVRLAVQGEPGFDVLDVEVKRGGVSYTVDHHGDGLAATMIEIRHDEILEPNGVGAGARVLMGPGGPMNFFIMKGAKNREAAEQVINYLMTPSVAAVEMQYHNYSMANADAIALLPADLKGDALFNVPSTKTDNYKYILNVSPDVVQKRTKIYTEFKAA